VDKTDRARHRDLTRRAFVQRGALVLAGSALAGASGLAAADTAGSRPKVRIGLVADLHYADKPPAVNRYYRETLRKLAEAARRFEEERTDLAVELGDVIDSADSLEVEKGYVRRIAKEFAALRGQQHFVLGNHCAYSLTKPEFLEIAGQERSYYSFDLGGYHFVVLDACFRKDGQPYGRRNFEWTDSSIPAAELEWLRSDLKQTRNKSILFVHQRLDATPPYGVQNAPEIRKVLEESGKVAAVLQGHEHKGDYKEIAGVHYVTLAAMVEGTGAENNAYAVMDILPGDVIRIRGFGKQKNRMG
jgi:alkaline phosphatase